MAYQIRYWEYPMHYLEYKLKLKLKLEFEKGPYVNSLLGVLVTLLGVPNTLLGVQNTDASMCNVAIFF